MPMEPKDFELLGRYASDVANLQGQCAVYDQALQGAKSQIEKLKKEFEELKKQEEGMEDMAGQLATVKQELVQAHAANETIGGHLRGKAEDVLRLEEENRQLQEKLNESNRKSEVAGKGQGSKGKKRRS